MRARSIVAGARRTPEWRERVWSGYDLPEVVALCNLCARGTMRSGSRFTWLVCPECLEVNRSIGAAFGSSRWGALPVGRHSLMNGVAYEPTSEGGEDLAGFVDQLGGLVDVWRRLGDWRVQEATRLVADPATVADSIPLAVWRRRFPASIGASVDALCRFVELDLPHHPSLNGLRQARRSFQAISRAT